MADTQPPPLTDDQLDKLRADATAAAAKVKQMKKDGASKEEIMPLVKHMQALRAQLALYAGQDSGNKLQIDSDALEDLLRRRMFVVPAFEIYNGPAGLFDFGPPGCAVKNHVLRLWRQHFVLDEGMLEIETTTLTPDIVLRTSGHVEKFADLMVKDVETGECYRADKLLEDHIEHMLEDVTLPSTRRDELRKISAQADAYSPEQLGAILTDLGVRATATGNELSAPFPFNLMFTTSIGPTGKDAGDSRPETAQGIFVNFRRLLEQNGGRMPFAAAQIGTAYRNEIAPRGGLLRVREFQMAEIEHFVDPTDKSHPKFANVSQLRPWLFPVTNQLGDGKMVDQTLGEAVAAGVIDNETLAYFMARTYQFLIKVGIKHDGLRFRQHLKTEMAHYATDCWDAEILMSAGWVECVGHADRACYDLKVHMAKTKVKMEATKRLSEPIEKEVLIPIFNKRDLGKALKKDQKVAVAHIQEMAAEDEDAARAFDAKLEADGQATISVGGKDLVITRSMVTFKTDTKRVVDIKYTPSVIEPSFGVGRVLTGIFEHSYSCRGNDKSRGVLSFTPAVAPCKCSVFPLTTKIDGDLVHSVFRSLIDLGVSAIVDKSQASIGKRYARTDEIGIPFAITVDDTTSTDNQVTVRERDTAAQIRVPIAEVPQLIVALVEGKQTWANCMATYTVVTTGEDKAASATGAQTKKRNRSGPAAGAGAGAGAGAAASAAAAPSATGSRALTAFSGVSTAGRFSRPAAQIAAPKPPVFAPGEERTARHAVPKESKAEAAAAPVAAASSAAVPAAAAVAAPPAPVAVAGAALAELNAALLTRTYISGVTPTADDARVFAAVRAHLAGAETALPHVARWMKHIASFKPAQVAAFPAATDSHPVVSQF